MKVIPKLLLLVFTVLIIPFNIFTQTKPDFILKQDFVPLLDSLVLPPANCDEAIALKIFDSIKMDFVFNTLIEQQTKRIDIIYTDLTINLNLNKSKRFNSVPPKGKPGPPDGSRPPAGMDDFRDAFNEMKDDIEDATLLIDKITVKTEKFKSELLQMQADVNDKLHKTFEHEEDKRELIINEFLNSAINKYNNYKRSCRENILILDEIAKTYSYGSKIKIIPLRLEIQNMQMAEVNVLKLLMKVTKEFINIGVKYHRD